jgi:predicted ArsR family transcriptional regulator
MVQRVAETGGTFLRHSRALRIIQAFNRDRRQLTLSDIAKLVDLPRASLRRTLHTLIHPGFVETDGRATPTALSHPHAGERLSDIEFQFRHSAAGRPNAWLAARSVAVRRDHDRARFAKPRRERERANWFPPAGRIKLARPRPAGGS